MFQGRHARILNTGLAMNKQNFTKSNTSIHDTTLPIITTIKPFKCA